MYNIHIRFSAYMDLDEGVGENSTPERISGDFGAYNVRNEVYRRLVDSGNEETIINPKFREQLDAHFDRLPVRYRYIYIHLFLFLPSTASLKFAL